MNMRVLVISLASLLVYVRPIFIVLDPNELRCVYRELNKNHLFSGTYFTSGEQEEANTVFIQDDAGNILWKVSSTRHADFKVDVPRDGVYSLCLHNTKDIQLTVSFEFYDDKKEEQLVSVQNIENLNSVIHTIRRKLDIIHSNMRNSAVRRATHLNISNSINSKISLYTGIKIVFLIFFSVFQVMMLTSIFGGVKVVNKISLGDSSELSSINSSRDNSDIYL